MTVGLLMEQRPQIFKQGGKSTSACFGGRRGWICKRSRSAIAEGVMKKDQGLESDTLPLGLASW